GAGYVGSHALALAFTALIGALYLIGGVELYRYRRASDGLIAALDAPPGPAGLAGWLAGLDPPLRGAVRPRIARRPAPPPPPGPDGLAGWLAGLDPTLRGAVRQRIASGQAPLPAPALTPYLVGLLVLLGMLGTLLGMLLTLRGTGMALQSASDLQAVRDSLA